MTPSVQSVQELETLLKTRTDAFLEVWATRDDKSLAALVNGDIGWVTLFRFPGDEGIWTCDPEGNDDEVPFRLANGQLDHYPEKYTVPLADVVKAFAHFFDTGDALPELKWFTPA